MRERDSFPFKEYNLYSIYACLLHSYNNHLIGSWLHVHPPPFIFRINISLKPKNLDTTINHLLVYFFGGLEYGGQSFAYVAHLWFLRCVWIRAQSATNLATHPPNLATHPRCVLRTDSSTYSTVYCTRTIKYFLLIFQEQLESCSGGLPPAAELYINLLDEDETSLATGRADSEEGDDTDASSLVNQPVASQRPTSAQSRRSTPRSSFSSADRSRPAAAAALDLGNTCVQTLLKNLPVGAGTNIQADGKR